MADAHIARKNWRCTLERAEKFISKQFFSDINLYSRLYPCTAPVTALTHFAAPGRITYKQAIRGEYRPVKLGDSFGPTWSTHWFKVVVDVPGEWHGHEVHLRWNSGSEAMVWQDGKPMQGLTGGDGDQERTDFLLTKCATSHGERFTVYIEMAANGMFGAGNDGLINAPDPNRTYALTKADISVFDVDCYQLFMDLEVIIGLAKHLPEGSPRAYDALYTANQIVNACDTTNRTSFTKAHKIAVQFFSQHNGASQHQVHAIGNCHIDCAWLWPAAETVRKCGRSFATAVRLMEKYPDFTFACSQAQQLEWVKIHYPALFQDIKKFVAKGQFIVVGGVWVEMDGNVPSGESFIRQFLVGQKFFQEEFGQTCQEFWLPDTFGYSAQLPQIMAECGIKYFLTQKLSWSLINKFPFNTFYWQGIDGSKCLTHFPPADTYESIADAKDVLKTVSNLKDKGRVHDSVLLYGHGDGGGGPSENMLEMLKRMTDVDGCPRVKLSRPMEFFKAVDDRDGSNLCTWVGELYLELHQGTFTSQAEVKKNNRRCEFLLHNAELMCSLLWAIDKEGSYPSDDLLKIWKMFLLNQFHDILPGSCIQEAITEALQAYRVVTSTATSLFEQASQNLLTKLFGTKSETNRPVVINTLCWDRDKCVTIPSDTEDITASFGPTQSTADGHTLVQIRASAMSIGPPCPVPQPWSSVSVAEDKAKGHVTMENDFICVTLDSQGRVVSLVHKPSERDAISNGRCGNQLCLFDDVPLFWDAWDIMPYYLETRKPLDELCKGGTMKIVEEGPLRASVQFCLSINQESSLTQVVTLDCTEPYVKFNTKVDWYENRKLLKVEFPVDVHSMNATYEIQFGHLQRPTHCNTSWDWAKYEVCGQRWSDLSEHDWGVSLMTDCKYGYSTHGNTMYISLLKSPKAPDAQADMGHHEFSYAVFPHTGILSDCEHRSVYFSAALEAAPIQKLWPS